MKTAFMLMAAVAALLLAYNAQAAPNVTTNYSQINAGLIIITNPPSSTVDNITIWKTGSGKMGNKELLTLFAGLNFANTNFPYGAHLVVGWDAPWSGDVLVVDKTSTNVLFDANYSAAEHFTIDIFHGQGAFSKIDDANNPGYEKRTGYNQAYFELEDDAGGTYLYGVGPCLEQFSQKWDGVGNLVSWSDKENFSINGANSNEKLDNDSGVTVTGGISASGGGKGGNSFLQ